MIGDRPPLDRNDRTAQHLQVNVRDLDLNLLVVFDVIMSTRSITAAGRQLNRAQPTISHALNRLRDIVGDPLFVRAGNRLEPTMMALDLAEPVSEALERLQTAFSRSGGFDPAVSQTTFTLLMSDIGQAGLLPPLVRRLRSVAPGIKIVASQLPREAYAEALQLGRADLAIGAIRHLKGGFYQQRLFSDVFVGVVCESNNSVGRRFDLQAYLDADHVSVHSPGYTERELERILLPPGQSRRIAVRVPSYFGAAGLLPGTQLVMTVPSRALQQSSLRPRLRIVELPGEAPSLLVQQFWHERQRQDAANRWLRSLVAELFMDWSGPEAFGTEYQ